jgi:Flp pilus assembly protein TadG
MPTPTASRSRRAAAASGRRSSQGAVAATGRLRARWRRVAARSDAGGATVELVVAMPLLLLIVMFVVQAGVWMHATHVAQAAATRAAATAAAYGSSAAAGQSTAAQTLAAIGKGVLTDPKVTVTRTATEVRVEVVGVAETVVPGVRWRARAVVVRPVERFVPDTQGAP